VVIRTYRPAREDSNQRTFHGVLAHTEEDPEHTGDDRRGVVVIRETDSDALVRLPIDGIRRAHLVYEG
jgi:hypothetical protein